MKLSPLAYANFLGALAVVGCTSSDGQSVVFGDAGLAACDHYFAAQYSRCGGPTLPASETARLLPRFEQLCRNQAALPGSGVTAATLEACASALDASPCQFPDGPPTACNFQGSLPGGGGCADSIQCQGGYCSGQQSLTPEGPDGPVTCGRCAPLAAVGQVCNSAGCPPIALCITTETSAPEPTYTCVAISQGGVGAPCDDLTAACRTGLYCAAETGSCQALRPAGATCGVGPGWPGGCAAPFGCGPSLTCVSAPDGGPCLGDFECASGLGCIPSGPCSNPARFGCSAIGACAPISWVNPGQPCSDSARCLVGSCNFGGFFPITQGPDGGLLWGTCPTVVADGQPCTVAPGNGTTTCDTFSECFAGTCSLLDGVGCN
jgi:hypothetical protein